MTPAQHEQSIGLGVCLIVSLYAALGPVGFLIGGAIYAGMIFYYRQTL